MKAKTLLVALGPDKIFPSELIKVLKRSNFRILFAKDIERTISSLTLNSVDLILLDLFLPPYGAYAVVRSLRELEACVPILLVGPSAETCELYLKEENLFAGCISLDEPEEKILRVLRSCLWRNASYSIYEVSQLIETAEQSMSLTDASGLIQYVNPRFSELTGFYPDQVIGENPRLWKSGLQPQSFYETMWKTIQSGKSWTGAVTNRRRDGSTYFAQMLIKPLLALYQTAPKGFLAVHTPLD